MLSTIGQCVALVTHAQAALAGGLARLDWRDNPWFAHTAEYRFGVGEPGGSPAGDDPEEWIESLVASHFVRAVLFAEPFNGMWDTIHRVGFAGGLRIAPVTAHADGTEVVWHERPRFDRAEGAWHLYRGGFQVAPGQPRVRTAPEEAGAALDAALAAMIAFQARYRPQEPQFSDMFRRGRRLIQAAGLAPRTLMPMSDEDEIRERIRPLLPERFDPTALALVAAVEASWGLGGMGWWNDWATEDDGARMLFRQATFPYYEGLIACLVAACEPPAQATSAISPTANSS